MKLKKCVRYVLLVAIIYIYLFDPFYIPNIGGLLGSGDYQYSIFILYVFSIFYFVFHYHQILKFRKAFSVEITCLFLMLLISFITTVLNNGSLTIFADHIKLFISNFLTPAFIIVLCYKWGVDTFDKVMRLLLLVSAVAGISTIVCILIPNIGLYYKTTMIKLESDDLLLEGFRGFGFSTRLTNDFGFIQGAFVALGVYSLRSNRWYFPFIILSIISALFNARTGVVIAAVGILLLFFAKGQKSKAVLICLAAIILIPILPNALYYFMDIAGFDGVAMNWMDEFFSDIYSILKTRDASSSMVGEDLFAKTILPVNISSWFIGIGQSVFHNGFHPMGRTDIGFLIQLNYGGIIYMVCILFYMLYMTKRMLRFDNKYMALFFMCSAILLNIKANFFLRQGGSLGLFLIVYYSYIYNMKIGYECSRTMQ